MRPLPLFGASRHRGITPMMVAVTLAAAVACGWPLLIAAPWVGGPLVALAAGFAAWSIARAVAPLPHANDNAPPAPSTRLADATEGRVSAAALVIEQPARLHGDAAYDTLHVENGAQVDGRVTPLVEVTLDAPLRLVDASDAG